MEHQKQGLRPIVVINKLDKTDQSDIRQSINQLIEMQLKRASKRNGVHRQTHFFGHRLRILWSHADSILV